MQCLKAHAGMELMQLDVCSSDSIQAAVSAVVQKLGRIDILVRASDLIA